MSLDRADWARSPAVGFPGWMPERRTASIQERQGAGEASALPLAVRAHRVMACAGVVGLGVDDLADALGHDERCIVALELVGDLEVGGSR